MIQRVSQASLIPDRYSMATLEFRKTDSMAKTQSIMVSRSLSFAMEDGVCIASLSTKQIMFSSIGSICLICLCLFSQSHE